MQNGIGGASSSQQSWRKKCRGLLTYKFADRKRVVATGEMLFADTMLLIAGMFYNRYAISE